MTNLPEANFLMQNEYQTQFILSEEKGQSEQLVNGH